MPSQFSCSMFACLAWNALGEGVSASGRQGTVDAAPESLQIVNLNVTSLTDMPPAWTQSCCCSCVDPGLCQKLLRLSAQQQCNMCSIFEAASSS